MPLTLTVVRYRNQAYSEPFGTSFDAAGGSIGRASGSDWVLPDEEKIISGKHALIEYRDGGYVLVDNSSNGVYVNDAEEPVGKGNSIALHHGDLVLIGDYEISVELHDELGTGTFGGPGSVEPPLERGLDVEDIFSGVEPTAAVPAVPQPRPEQEHYRPPDLIPDDLTGFQTSPAAGGKAGSDAFADDLSGFEDFGEPAEAAGDDGIPDDWNTTPDFGLPEERPAPPVAHPEPRATPKPKPGSRRPRSAPAKGGKAQAGKARAPAARPRAPQRGDVPGMDAFLAGAGISESTLATLTPKMAFVLGRTFREAVHGTMTVLMARAKMKSEFRLDMTVIRPEENNPLKFSLGIDEALQKLVAAPSRGHLGAVDAMREAYQDIQAHQIAVMAGMRAALKAVLNKLHPTRLERRLQSGSMLDAVLPQVRKARTWDLFTELYNDIAHEAEEDFERLFGEEFRRAYEHHIKILTGSSKPPE